MRTEQGLHMTDTEKKALKFMRAQNITEARIGHKDYFIRPDGIHIIEMRKPLGMIGEKAELIRTIYPLT